jgi:hypothetical protein
METTRYPAGNNGQDEPQTSPPAPPSQPVSDEGGGEGNLLGHLICDTAGGVLDGGVIGAGGGPLDGGLIGAVGGLLDGGGTIGAGIDDLLNAQAHAGGGGIGGQISVQYDQAEHTHC